MRGTSILGFLILLVAVVGCSPKVAPSITTDTKTIIRDSIITKEVPRIVQVTVPGEKIVVTEYIECDSVTNKPKAKHIKAKGNKAAVDVKISEDGKVVASGGCDSLQAVVTAMDKEIFHLKHESKEKSTKVEKPIVIYRTRTIDIICRWFTGIVSMFLLLVLIYKLKP